MNIPDVIKKKSLAVNRELIIMNALRYVSRELSVLEERDPRLRIKWLGKTVL